MVGEGVTSVTTSSGGLASFCHILKISFAYDERTSAPDGGLDLERERVDSKIAV